MIPEVRDEMGEVAMEAVGISEAWREYHRTMISCERIRKDTLEKHIIVHIEIHLSFVIFCI